MSGVKRYNLDVDKFGHVRAYESEHGRWVKRDDYAALEAERDALQAQVEVMRADSDLYRQWFNAVQDLHPRYLEQKDYQAAVRLLERLNIRVPLSVVAGAALQAKPRGLPSE